VITVVHAYSRANAGDGLLVDLTLSRLARIGVDVDEITVVALDADSFSDLPHVVHLGTPGRAADLDTVRAIVTGSAAAIGRGNAGRVLASADAHIAVGGGYLRAGRAVNAVGTGINHLPALRAVARSGAPALYLPQSVGPLRGPVGAAVRRLLARVSEVHVRDDRSREALRGLSNVRRTADLAVLDIADSVASISPRSADGRPVIVGRALPAHRTYVDGLRALASDLGEVVWAVQAEGSAAKSDRTFYDELGVPVRGLVRDVLADDEPGPVVSVRLHGALQAVMSGVPAVHLGYERKSWGAFEDLGLADYVHNARDFDPRAVAEQVRGLRRDATSYWDAVRSSAPRLREQSSALNASLRRVCGRPISDEGA
jgi:polysaccharide pyruvyl transferase WcaK-like protein